MQQYQGYVIGLMNESQSLILIGLFFRLTDTMIESKSCQNITACKSIRQGELFQHLLRIATLIAVFTHSSDLNFHQAK
jgi:hypothetical protein